MPKRALSIQNEEEPPRKKRIPLSEREFTIIDDKPNWRSIELGGQKASNLTQSLNQNAEKLGFKKAIFVGNSSKKRVEVQQEDYAEWKARSTTSEKNKQPIKYTAAKDRVFTTIDGKPGWISTEAGKHKARDLANNLNINAKNLGFKAIFIANGDTNCVEVRQADHAEWEAKLAIPKEKKSPSKYIASKNRVFTSIDDRPGWLSTEAGKQEAIIVAKTLNNNANKLGFKTIFVANGDTNCVEVLQEHHAEWEAKLDASSEKNKQLIKYTAAKDRIFTSIDGKPGWISTEAGKQKAISVAKTLNHNAKKLGLEKAIFIANPNTNCVEVALHGLLDLVSAYCGREYCVSSTSHPRDKRY